MKAALIFAGLLAVALAGEIHNNVETKTVDKEFVHRQKLVWDLLKYVPHQDFSAEYYKIGKEYNIESNIDKYSNKKAVEEFLAMYKNGMLPKTYIFSIFYDEMKYEAIALFHLFLYAKDFETFYKTAAWARVHMNEGMFIYSYSIAVIQRDDTQGIVLPAPYEIYPYFFFNSEVIGKLYRVKMQDGIFNYNIAARYGITVEDEKVAVYANYTGWNAIDNEETKLSYFTEDIGLNTYYYYFHAVLPFWMTGDEFGVLKERRGEIFFFVHQQLLARYYLERLANGLGEIPVFDWRSPIETGYTADMINHNYYPFIQRHNYYDIESTKNVQDLEFVEAYEKQFYQILEHGSFKSHNIDVDLKNSKSVNFVGNYWQSNADLYEHSGHKYHDLVYETIARGLLGASHESELKSSVLDHFQTSLRDPVFYQFYKRILNYFFNAKQFLEPYTQDKLHFVGVKINNVTVDDLVTFYDFYDVDAHNMVMFNEKKFTESKYSYLVRQPRLNHKNFKVNIDVKSDVATDATVKIFLAPARDSFDRVINLEDNWMNFYEIDAFKTKLTQGKNVIVRDSEEFYMFKDDSLPMFELNKLLEQGKIPVDMSEKYEFLPRRLMLPRGNKGGFELQMFVMIYPHTPVPQEYGEYSTYFVDNKPLGYPFDRPVSDYYFVQPNMFFKDVYVYHDGEENIHEFVGDHQEYLTAKHQH